MSAHTPLPSLEEIRAHLHFIDRHNRTSGTEPIAPWWERRIWYLSHSGYPERRALIQRERLFEIRRLAKSLQRRAA